jgi:Fur family peroxide stress response transcriptional regulator
MKKARVIEKYRCKRGFKLTPQRIAILECLDGNTAHPTAEEIYCEIRKTHPTVSFATVYNTLEALRDMGDLVELQIDPARRRYDPDTSAHHHAICSSCGVISDVFADSRPAPVGRDGLPAGFRLSGVHVSFHGMCGDCARAN